MLRLRSTPNVAHCRSRRLSCAPVPEETIILNGKQKGPDVDATASQCWRSHSPMSLVRAPLRFTGEEDRQHYRHGIRTLALVYVGILVLVVAVTALRGEWRKQDVTEKATAGMIDTPRRH